MAEFQEVMREWVRVRKATASSTEENVLSVYPLEAYDDCLIASIEKNVMKWAAEYPEPVYPTWGEYLHTLHNEPSSRELSKPIPADIAQKLGIEPK